MTTNTIEIIKKDDVNIDLTFEESDGTPVDLTGGTVKFTVRPALDEAVILSKEVTTHTDPTNGKTQVSLTSTETDSLEAGNYVWGVTFINSAGKRNSSTVGSLVVLENVTE